MIWDSLLWQINPHFVSYLPALLERIRDEGSLRERMRSGSEGMHRDNLQRRIVKNVAGWFDLDDLPIDTVEGGIAIVTVSGVLIKQWSYYAASYRALTEAFQKLRQSRDIRAVIVKFDTPGGTVDGLAECATALDELASEKLTVGQVDGGCYSAGYFLAARCGSIACGPTMHVGNIGTVLSLTDYSEYFTAAGLRNVTLKTGEIKGVGIIGDPITEPQTAFLQSLVDQHFAHFRTAVMTGRNMTDEQFAAVSDGSWWLGEVALGLGLIDLVSTPDETLAAIRNQVG